MTAPVEERSEPEIPASPEISIVLPIFNEAGNLEPLLAEIAEVMECSEISYEVVAVDDGSEDDSLEILEGRAVGDRRLRVISSPRRSGQSAALAAGIRAAKAPVVVTMDADLQNDPWDIPRLLEALQGWDVVSGIRRHRKDSWVRKVSSRVANGVRRRVLDDGIHDVGCSLKAYRREFLRGLPPFRGMHRFLPALTGVRGARIREIEVNHRPRRHGRSKYGIGNRLWRGIVDLCGVRWLASRWLDLSSYEER